MEEVQGWHQPTVQQESLSLSQLSSKMMAISKHGSWVSVPREYVHQYMGHVYKDVY